jgi:hypothetical protein
MVLDAIEGLSALHLPYSPFFICSPPAKIMFFRLKYLFPLGCPVYQLYFQWCTLTDEMVGVNPRIDTETALSDVCESIWFQ